ncbi:MAG: hypothetical protein A4E41_01092 [Methanoregulaceae archaeon PtaU1.Bin066]|nr:MAG: hypothetical protein A4E41_01092 [Methanoregulaceae archaeon PtaU1.Bin066]
MRLDRLRTCDHLVADALEEVGLIIEFHAYAGMGVDDGCILEVLEQPLLGGHGALELDLDPCSVGPVPFNFALFQDLGFVGLDIDLDEEPEGRILRAGAGGHNSGNACSKLCIEHCGTDANPLLSPALAYLVEPRAVKEFSKHERYLCGDDPGTVVLDGNPEYVAFSPLDAHKDVGEDHGLLAGV